MRRAWWSAVALIALAMPSAAQARRADTLNVLPQLVRSEALDASPPLIARPFIGGLHVTLVRSDPELTSISNELVPITRADLAVLGLSPAQAFALATRNLRRLLAPYTLRMPEPSSEMSGMRSVEGELLAASRLLLDDDWRTAAAELGGPLVAVIPTSSSLMFGRDTSTQVSRRKSIPAAQFLELALGVLRGYVREREALSINVFRWTDAGWRVVPPMTDAQRRALQRSDNTEQSGGLNSAVTAPTTTHVAPPPVYSPGQKPTSASPKSTSAKSGKP